MPTNPKNHTEAHLRYAIWILIAVLVALGVFLVFQYRQVRHAETSAPTLIGWPLS